MKCPLCAAYNPAYKEKCEICDTFLDRSKQLEEASEHYFHSFSKNARTFALIVSCLISLCCISYILYQSYQLPTEVSTSRDFFFTLRNNYHAYAPLWKEKKNELKEIINKAKSPYNTHAFVGTIPLEVIVAYLEEELFMNFQTPDQLAISLIPDPLQSKLIISKCFCKKPLKKMLLSLEVDTSYYNYQASIKPRRLKIGNQLLPLFLTKFFFQQELHSLHELSQLVTGIQKIQLVQNYENSNLVELPSESEVALIWETYPSRNFTSHVKVE